MIIQAYIQHTYQYNKACKNHEGCKGKGLEKPSASIISYCTIFILVYSKHFVQYFIHLSVQSLKVKLSLSILHISFTLAIYSAFVGG